MKTRLDDEALEILRSALRVAEAVVEYPGRVIGPDADEQRLDDYPDVLDELARVICDG